MCRQQAANHYRLHGHRFEEPKPNVGEDMPSEEEDAQSQLERHELDHIVQRILDEMSPQFRDMLIRREFRKESLESIAGLRSMRRQMVWSCMSKRQPTMAGGKSSSFDMMRR